MSSTLTIEAKAHNLNPRCLDNVRFQTESLLRFFNRNQATLMNSNDANRPTLEAHAWEKAVTLVKILSGKQLWCEESQWLHPTRIWVYTNMLRVMGGPSVDWNRLYAVPPTTTPMFFMEGYDGPSPPIPPITSTISTSANSSLPAQSSLPPISADTQASSVPIPNSSLPALPPISADTSVPIPNAPQRQSTPEAGPAPEKKPAEPKPQQSRAKPEAGTSSGRKRRGDSLDVRPRKTRIVSAQHIEESSDEETPMLKPNSRNSGNTAKPRLKQQPVVEITVKPRSKATPRVSPDTATKAALKAQASAEKLEKQNAAIKMGEYKLAIEPCIACSKRKDKQTVPCAESTSGVLAACFTCNTGKTKCSKAGGNSKKKTEGEEAEEVKIVVKKTKKRKAKKDEEAEDGGEKGKKKAKKSKAKKLEPMAEGAEDGGEEESVVVVRRPKTKAMKQDVEMAEVSEGESFDFESIKEEDSEMVDMTLGVDAEARATPAIVIERPTPTPPVQPKLSLAMDEMPTVPDVGQSSASLMPNLGQSSATGIMPDLGQSSGNAAMPIVPDLGQLSAPANDMVGILVNSTPALVDIFPSQPEQSVSNSRRVSPPHVQELHPMYIKKVDFRSHTPPPAFDMHAIQHEIRRLGQDQTNIQNTLREQQAQLTIASEHTGIDPSALLPPFVNSTSLSQRLASLEEMTQRLQEVESAGDRLAEQHEAFEGEVRNMMKVTPAALQEQVAKSMAELTNRVHQAEQAQETLTTSYSALTEGQIKLGNRQTIVEQIVLNHFGHKIMTNAQINATKGTADIGINTMKGTVDIGINTDKSAEELVQASSPAPIQSAAPPTPAQASSPAPIQLAAVQASSPPPIQPTAPSNLVQAESPAPIYLAPKPVRATCRGRSPSPFTVGTRRSPQLIASSDDHPSTPTNEDPQ
ncbi:uncharacterized protein LACBIDRAFT_323931 [Laccaria bicolor S238N-H82]|uniref:Predicted protein n=1 Tax=Laccaria bicolor (strain S238N-H82 / ATCC MYA-4686) TaxID=486041 RepID=B0D035_LACBS|nr:uncharacterized protein LACBIDRAFT_323931 [Laccaria bicolor S238N-H82]EDR11387.1 predicted protein [Laccaria bicolor S238N-H82]|eukprot:XP_001877284.1 predicted protein [Laccaria bicolor S238N-H82]